MLNSVSKGDLPCKIGVGNLLDKKTEVLKASSQCLSGMDAWAKRMSPSSTILLCFLSTNTLRLWGHEFQWIMPWVWSKLVKALYSPPQSDWIARILWPTYNSTWFLKISKDCKASDFCLSKKSQVKRENASVKWI